MCRPQRPEGEEVAEKAPAETENQGPPHHVAPPSRQPARHVRGRSRVLQLNLAKSIWQELNTVVSSVCLYHSFEV